MAQLSSLLENKSTQESLNKGKKLSSLMADNRFSLGKKIVDKWGDTSYVVGIHPADNTKIITTNNPKTIGDARFHLTSPIENYPIKQNLRTGEKSKNTGNTYYHGSNEGIISKIDANKSLFGGMFFSPSQQAAASHGKYLHSIEVSRDDIAKTADLENAKDSHVKSVFGHIKNINDREKALGFAIKDNQPVADRSGNIEPDIKEYNRILGGKDFGESSWEAQRLRGALAQKMGFKAVEMPDEHGTSILAFPNNKLKFEGVSNS